MWVGSRDGGVCVCERETETDRETETETQRQRGRDRETESIILLDLPARTVTLMAIQQYRDNTTIIDTALRKNMIAKSVLYQCHSCHWLCVYVCV
jgi:hypothetical protein